ncbi:hypothetical protein [Methylorubrum sp. SB2]|uniref:hypothetical protein n=1 Tax=Methylorubrum subtropicum TaxID=3138812 RepID=UPI00313E9D7D
MPSKDAEALAELARLCGEVRASLSEPDHKRLRVLLDMILIDLAREGFCARADVPHEPAGEPDALQPHKSL